MIHFDFQDEFQEKISTSRMKTVISTALSFNQVLESDVELTVVVTNDPQIQELNREYLGVDSPTDVLSFPMDEMDPETNLRYLGDIIISYPRCLEQAQKSGHTAEAEMELLIVHAVLHLLGFDHAEPDEKTQMWNLQKKILVELATPLNVFPD